MKSFLISMLLIGFFGFISNIATAVSYNVVVGTVTRVLDGDTIEVGGLHRVRLAHIDAPEKNQAFGKEAAKYLTDLCLGETAEVTIHTKDKYGRYVGVVVCQGYNANQSLVANGYAWHYKKYSNDDEYDVLERAARRVGAGLWATNAVAPWDFRATRSGK